MILCVCVCVCVPEASDFHDKVMPVCLFFNAVMPEGPKFLGIQNEFSALLLADL